MDNSSSKTMTTERTLGQVAYEAWRKAMGDEAPVEPWELLFEAHRDAWEAAALAVVHRVFHGNPPETRKEV